MMNLKNYVQLTGRLSAEPLVKTLENGTRFARFTIAINESFKNKKGEKVSNTQWHTVVAWGSLADIAERILHKGTQVTVDGKLTNRTFIDKDGLKRTNTEVVANELFVLSNKKAA